MWNEIFFRRTCCRPSFEILDGAGDVIFTFTNDCCYPQYFGFFMDYAIYVKDNEDEIIAKIVKKSYHNGDELIGVENKLHIEFIKKIKATEKLLLINAALLVSLNNFEDSKRLCCWVRGFVEDIDHGLVAEQRSSVLSIENVTICCWVLILLKATVTVKILLISFLWQLAVSYDGRMIRALIVILYFYFSLFYTIYILIYRILFIWYQFT